MNRDPKKPDSIIRSQAISIFPYADLNALPTALLKKLDKRRHAGTNDPDGPGDDAPLHPQAPQISSHGPSTQQPTVPQPQLQPQPIPRVGPQHGEPLGVDGWGNPVYRDEGARGQPGHWQLLHPGWMHVVPEDLSYSTGGVVPDAVHVGTALPGHAWPTLWEMQQRRWRQQAHGYGLQEEFDEHQEHYMARNQEPGWNGAQGSPGQWEPQEAAAGPADPRLLQYRGPAHRGVVYAQPVLPREVLMAHYQQQAALEQGYGQGQCGLAPPPHVRQHYEQLQQQQEAGGSGVLVLRHPQPQPQSLHAAWAAQQPQPQPYGMAQSNYAHQTQQQAQQQQQQQGEERIPLSLKVVQYWQRGPVYEYPRQPVGMAHQQRPYPQAPPRPHYQQPPYVPIQVRVGRCAGR